MPEFTPRVAIYFDFFRLTGGPNETKKPVGGGVARLQEEEGCL